MPVCVYLTLVYVMFRGNDARIYIEGCWILIMYPTTLFSFFSNFFFSSIKLVLRRRAILYVYKTCKALKPYISSGIEYMVYFIVHIEIMWETNLVISLLIKILVGVRKNVRERKITNCICLYYCINIFINVGVDRDCWWLPKCNGNHVYDHHIWLWW